MAVCNKLTKLDWWASADTDPSPAVGSEGVRHTKNASSPLSLWSSARRPPGEGGGSWLDHHKGNKQQQQSVQEIAVQEGSAKKEDDGILKLDNCPHAVVIWF